mgnify:CR=1 FL=1
MNILDIFLLPKKLYEKFSGKRYTLVLGIVLVGIADMMFTFYQNQGRLLTGKSPMVLYFNISLAVVMTLLIGFIDVLFFSVPLFDLFKRFKREKSIGNEGEHLVKFMKVYICANLLVIPLNTLFYFLFGNTDFTRSNYAGFLAYAYIILLPLWVSAAVSRGANAIYGFIAPLRRLVFLAAFIWSSVLSLVIGYIVDHWLISLFK